VLELELVELLFDEQAASATAASVVAPTSAIFFQFFIGFLSTL
jgi:hypothetical protein